MSIVGLLLVLIVLLVCITEVILYIQAQDQPIDWEEESRARRARWIEEGCGGSIIK